MQFVIPKEHRNTPEAKELVRIDKAFTKSCAREARALKRNLLVKNQDAFLKLNEQTHKLQQKLQQATEAYDKATGEPKPLELSDPVKKRIKASFSHEEQGHIRQKLAKTLAYMERNSWSDPRILEAIFIVADGNADQFHDACKEALTDYRDLLLKANI